jgi:hypothetical protein
VPVGLINDVEPGRFQGLGQLGAEPRCDGHGTGTPAVGQWDPPEP